jgi:hypothetical protein
MMSYPQARSSRGALVTLMITAGLIAGCATDPKPRPTALDPANPLAPESPSLVVASLIEGNGVRPSETSGEGEGEGGKAGKQSGATYTCPMHPEVISDAPGRCPKCGMKLVPKEPPQGKK